MSSKLVAAAVASAAAKSVQETLDAGFCGEIDASELQQVQSDWKSKQVQSLQGSATTFNPEEEEAQWIHFNPDSNLAQQRTCRDAKREFELHVAQSEKALAARQALIFEASEMHVQRCRALSGKVRKLEDDLRSFVSKAVVARVHAELKVRQAQQVLQVQQQVKQDEQQWKSLADQMFGLMLSTTVSDIIDTDFGLGLIDSQEQQSIQQLKDVFTRNYYDYMRDVAACLVSKTMDPDDSQKITNDDQITHNLIVFSEKQFAALQPMQSQQMQRSFDLAASVNSIRIEESFSGGRLFQESLQWRKTQLEHEVQEQPSANQQCKIRTFGTSSAYDDLVPVRQLEENYDHGVCASWKQLVATALKPVLLHEEQQWQQSLTDQAEHALKVEHTVAQQSCATEGGDEEAWAKILHERKEQESLKKALNDQLKQFKIEMQQQPPASASERNVDLKIKVPQHPSWSALLDVDTRDKFITLHATFDALLAHEYTKHALHDLEYANFNSKQSALEKKVQDLVSKENSEDFQLDSALKNEVSKASAGFCSAVNFALTSSEEQYQLAQRLSIDGQRLQLVGHKLCLGLAVQAEAVVSSLTKDLENAKLSLKDLQAAERDLLQQTQGSHQQTDVYEKQKSQWTKAINEIEEEIQKWKQRSADISQFLRVFKVSDTDLVPGEYHNLHLGGGSAYEALEKLTKQVLKYHNEVENLSQFQTSSKELFESLQESEPTLGLSGFSLKSVNQNYANTLSLRGDSMQFVYDFFELRKNVRQYISTRGQISAALDGVMQQLYDALGLNLKVSDTHPKRNAHPRRLPTEERTSEVNAVELGSSTELGANTNSNPGSGAAHFVVLCTAASLLL